MGCTWCENYSCWSGKCIISSRKRVQASPQPSAAFGSCANLYICLLSEWILSRRFIICGRQQRLSGRRVLTLTAFTVAVYWPAWVRCTCHSTCHVPPQPEENVLKRSFYTRAEHQLPGAIPHTHISLYIGWEQKKKSF